MASNQSCTFRSCVCVCVCHNKTPVPPSVMDYTHSEALADNQHRTERGRLAFLASVPPTRWFSCLWSLKKWHLTRFRKTLGASRCNNLTPATSAVPPEQIKRQHPAPRSPLSQLNFLLLTEEQHAPKTSSPARLDGLLSVRTSTFVAKNTNVHWSSGDRERKKDVCSSNAAVLQAKNDSLLSTPELFPLKYPRPHRIQWRPICQVFQTNT